MTPDQIQEIFLTQPLSVKELKDILESYELENGEHSREDLEMRLKMATFKKLLGPPTIKFDRY